MKRRRGTSAGGVAIRPGQAILAFVVLVTAIALAWIQSPDPLPSDWSKKDAWRKAVYPIERNATLRLPAVPAELRSVHFMPSGLQGWMVGTGGAVYTTNDGGVTWTVQPSGVSATLYAVAFDSTGRHGWAVGDAGTIIETVDGGASWSTRTTNISQRLTSLSLSESGRKAWAFGDFGVMLAQSDGGEWKVLSDARFSRNASILAAHFAMDELHGWAVTYGGDIRRTEDGGATWKSYVFGDSALFGIFFLDDMLNGWAVGYGGVILRSRDGGATWSRQPQAVTDSTTYLRGVFFEQNGNRGWVTGSGGTIMRTDDGGETWSSQDDVFGDTYFAVRLRGNRGWIVGSSGVVLATEDSGNTWVPRTRGGTSSLSSVYVDASGRKIWAGGGFRGILHSQDSGNTWTLQKHPSDGFAAGIHFNADGRRGWAVAGGASILRTIDGGAKWSEIDTHAESALTRLAFATDGIRGFAVGSNNTILRTIDAGEHWEQMRTSGNHYYNAVQVDGAADSAWVVGSESSFAHTTDGGEEWMEDEGISDSFFNDVYRDSASGRMWAVGGAGVVLSSMDNGAAWQAVPNGIKSDLKDITFDAAGRRGWIVGDRGTILTTTDGVTWTMSDSKVGAARFSIAFDSSGVNGWAVGDPPALLRTRDGGKTWEPRDWPLKYQRYPAPWFWLVVAIAVAILATAFRRGEFVFGAAAMGTSDNPSGDFARDRLQFGPLARGISRYLRNTRTEPPLTLAICGDWGTGKSTLMALACTDMRKYGGKPVWFNAWHHQSEEHLLAALLAAVRARGLPSLASIDGLTFRMRLLWIRSKKHVALALLTLVFASVLIGYLLGHTPEEWARLWGDIELLLKPAESAGSSAGKPELSLHDIKWLSAQLLTGIGVLWSVIRGLKPFGANPAILLADTANSFKIKDASDQASFRNRFAEEFSEVTQALPYPLVIVIDDLDRCQSETILTVMEAVNFLVSSGRCFVVFGMAPDRVQAALAIGFKDIANEMGALRDKEPVSEAQEDSRRARAYARDYLDKLINIEIAVPARTDIAPHVLLSATSDSSRGVLRSLLAGVLQYLPLLLVGCIVLAGAIGGSRLRLGEAELSTARIERDVTPVRPAAQNSSGAASGPAIPAANTLVPRYLPATQDGDHRSAGWWFLALVFLGFMAWSGLVLLHLLRKSRHQVDDSEKFLHALRIWTPLVREARRTPRAIKRFGNRIRYLAMLQQAESLDRTGFDDTRDFLSRWLGRKRKRKSKTDEILSTDTTPHIHIDEHILVAMGAMYEVFGVNWTWSAEFRDGYEFSAVGKKAAEAYVNDLGAAWPPSEHDILAFNRLLAGVRMSGEPRKQAAPQPQAKQSAGSPEPEKDEDSPPRHTPELEPAAS